MANHTVNTSQSAANYTVQSGTEQRNIEKLTLCVERPGDPL